MNKEVKDKIKSLRELGGNLCILREELKKEAKVYIVTTNSVTLKVRECLESAIEGLNKVAKDIEEGIVGIVYQEFLDEEDLENVTNFEEIITQPLAECEATTTCDVVEEVTPNTDIVVDGMDPRYDVDGFYAERDE